MQKKLSLLVLVALCLPGVGVTQQPQALRSVDDLIRVAVEQNRDLAAARASIDEGRGALRQSGVRPAPVLALSGSTGRATSAQNENQYGATIAQTIEAPGRRSNRMAAADQNRQAAEAAYNDRLALLVLSLRTAYAELSAERHKLRVLDEWRSLQQAALRLTEARVHEGDAALLEANLAKNELSRILLMHASVESRIRTADTDLRRLAGLSSHMQMPLAAMDLSEPGAVADLKSRALEQRDDLIQARFEEAREMAAEALARAEARPDLSLSAGWSRQSSGFDGLLATNAAGQLKPLREQNSTLNFSLSIPLRAPNSTRGMREVAAARLQAARAHRQALEQSIPLEVESAFERWKIARSNATEIQNTLVPANAENLHVMQEAYTLGQMRMIDVLNEQRRSLDTQMMAIDANQDAERAWAELERSAGGQLK